MRNKYPKTFSRRAHSLREKRLCFEDTPEYGPTYEDGEKQPDMLLGLSHNTDYNEVIRTTEEQRVHWKNIESILTMAVGRSGNKRIQEIWKSDELRKWIVAQVVQNPRDGTLTWLTPLAQAHAERAEKTSFTENNNLRAVNLAITNRVADMVETIEDTVGVLEAEMDNVTNKGSVLPKEVNISELITILKKLQNQEELKARQHALSELVRVIVYGSEDTFEDEITSTLENETEALGDELKGLLDTELKAVLSDTKITLPEERKRQLLLVLKKHAKLDFTEEDRAKLKTAVAEIETELADLNANEDIIHERAFAPQTQYLRRLAGDNPEHVIRASVQDDYKFNRKLYITSLEALKGRDLTKDELEAIDDILKKNETYILSKEAGVALINKFDLTEERVRGLAKELGIELDAGIDLAEAITTVSKFIFKDITIPAGSSFEEIQIIFANKALKELLDNGKQAFEAKHSKFLEAAEKTVPGFTKEDFYKGLTYSWDLSEEAELNTYMADNLGLKEGVGYDLRRMVLRSRVPEEVAEFMIDGDVKLRIGDAIELAGIESLTGSPTFEKDKISGILEFMLNNSAEFRATPAEARTRLNEKVTTYITKPSAATKEELKTFANYALFDFPYDTWKDVQNLITGPPPPANLEADLNRVFNGELVSPAEIGAFRTLVSDYVDAVKADRTTPTAATRTKRADAKKAVIDKLGEELKGLPKTRDKAIGLVVSDFTAEAQRELMAFVSGMPPDVEFADYEKVRDLSALLHKYNSTQGTPEFTEHRDELINIFTRRLGKEEAEEMLSRIDTGDNLSAKATKAILDLLIDEDKETIDKDRFVEVATFLFLEEPNKVTKETPAAMQRNALKRAEELWERLKEDGIIQDAGADTFKVLDREELERRMQAQKIGKQAKFMHEKMHESGMYELEVGDAAKQYMDQFFKDLWETGGSWVSYMQNFSEVLVPTEGGNLEEIVRKRRRLKEVRDALQEALDSTEESETMIEKAIEAIQGIRTRAETLRKPLEPTRNIGQSVDQAHFLLEANAQIITVLQAESGWDELPDPIRQTSLWIALQKGRSPEEGLLLAQNFIRAYHRAPRALKFYEDAQGAYEAAPTEENLQVYLNALVNFQSIANLDPNMFEAYKQAILNFHNIRNFSGEMMVEQKMFITAQKVVDEKVESVAGTVVAVDETKINPILGNVVSVTVQTPEGEEVKAWFDIDAFQQQFSVDAAKDYDAARTAFVNSANAYEQAKNPRDPTSTAYEHFWRSFVGGLSEPDKQSLLEYRRKIETVTEIEGKSNLDFMYHRHKLVVKPAAIFALANSTRTVEQAGVSLEGVQLTNESFSMDKWLTDGHREFSEEPLRLIIDGPPAAKEALIKAYLERADVYYDTVDDSGAPAKKLMSAAEANRIVSEIKRRLQFQSEQKQPAFDILGKDELFKDPIEGGFRGMLESMQDMWAGDWVDKGKVVLGVLAATMLLKHLWKSDSGIGKMGKYAMIGLPILMVANSAYKNRTGRDLLGEKLLFMSGKQKNSIIEQWRRRSLEYGDSKYEVLGHPAGFAAMQEVMSRDDPISIKALSDWRANVKRNGFNDYSKGAPPNLDISVIQMHMGIEDTYDDNKAYEVAFLAYEAMCVDVAALHKIDSGDIRERANWGNDYLVREYANADSYTGQKADQAGKVDLQKVLQGKNIGMLDAMLMEAQIAAINADDKNIETALERIATLAGVGVDKVVGLGKRAVVEGQFRLKQAGEVIPETFTGIKEWTLETYEDVSVWFEARFGLAEKVVVDNFLKTYEALKGVGIGIVEVAPGVLEFIVDKSVDITAGTFEAIRKAHAHLVKLPASMGYVEEFEEFLLSTFGFDVIEELNNEEAERQYEIEISSVASLWNGGGYPMLDVKQDPTKSTTARVGRTEKLRIIEPGTSKAMPMSKVRDQIEKDMVTLAKDVYDIDVTVAGLAEKLSPAQRRFLLEIWQANMFKIVGLNGEITTKVSEYNLDVATKQNTVDQIAEEVVTVDKTHRQARDRVRELRPDFELAWKKDLREIERAHGVTFAELEAADSLLVSSAKEKLKLTDEMNEKAENKTLESWEKLNYERQIRSLESDIDRAKKTINEADTRLKTLVVCMVIAKLPPGDRTPDKAKTLTFTDEDVKKVLRPSSHGDAAAINHVKKRLLVFRDDIVQGHDIFLAAEKNEKRQLELKQQVEQRLGVARSELTQLLENGVDPVEISTADLFGPINGDVFTETRGDRSVILSNTFAEKYNIGEIVPLGWLFGNARDKAKQMATAWKTRRMNYDGVLQKTIKSGKNVEAVASYERYLEHVALGEIFIRGMLESPDGGQDEAKSPLHISVNEARHLDEYLKERERLLSFSQFLEVWEQLEAADKTATRAP